MKARKTLRSYCLLFALLIFLGMQCGCGESGSAEGLPGVYVASYSFAKSTIILRANGEYEQTVTLNDGSKGATRKGIWKFNDKLNYITFFPQIIMVVDALNRPNPNINAPPEKNFISGLDVVNWFGRLQLGESPNVPYVKQRDAIL